MFNSISIGKVLNLYEDSRNAFFHFDFIPTFWKNRKSEFFFSKIYFLIKHLSTYCNPEFLQIKNTSFAMNASGKAAKKFGIWLRVLRGKLILEPPYNLSDIFFFLWTQVFGSFGVKSKHLWHWALVWVECHLRPPPGFPTSSKRLVSLLKRLTSLSVKHVAPARCTKFGSIRNQDDHASGVKVLTSADFW